MSLELQIPTQIIENQLENVNSEDETITYDTDYDALELILNDEFDRNRYTLFPIKYHSVYDMYKKHQSTFWTAEEINLQEDIRDWDSKLTDDEKHFIKYVLAFFAASDGIVMENISMNFANDVKIPEARAFYAFQEAMEVIHSETYSLLIDTYIKDNNEKNKLFNAIENMPAISKKAEWAIKWINDKTRFAERLVAFAAVEGIFFSGAFCAIFWIKEKGVMEGLTFSNELISRDESLHTEFAILLYSMLKYKLSQERVYEIIKDAVELEKEFIIEALPCRLLGMNSDNMSQYIEFVSDRLLVQLGCDKLYNATNPFEFMDRIGMDVKGNFFEVKVSNYSKAQLHNTKNTNCGSGSGSGSENEKEEVSFEVNDEDDF